MAPELPAPVVQALLRRERLALVGRLLRGVVHNLSGGLQMLRRPLDLMELKLAQGQTQDLAGKLSAIHNGFDRTSTEVDLLAAKASQLQSEAPAPLDLASLAREQLAFWRADMYFKHETQVREELPPSSPKCRASYLDVACAFNALGANSLEAMIPAGGHSLSVSWRQEDGHSLLLVADDGPGPSPAMAPLMFQPFTGDKGPEHDGLGLYLAGQALAPWGGRVHWRAGSSPTTFSLARGNQDPEVAALILEALVAIGATGLLVGAAVDPDPRVTEVAVAALGRLGAPEAGRALTQALEHASAKVRRQAAQQLGLLDCTPAAPPPVEACLQGQDPRVQREAAMALGRLRQARSVAALGSLLDHPRLELRIEALHSLLNLGGEEVRSLLLRGLDSGHARRRELCALGLGALGPGSETRRLVALLADPDTRVRRAAVQALENRNLPEVRELLVQVLGDLDPHLRHQAVESLGRMGAQEAVPALVVLLGDTDQSLRIAAARFLSDIGAEEASAHLIGLLADPDPEIRATATRSLQQISGGWG